MQDILHDKQLKGRTSMTAYDELIAFQRDTEALGQISGRMGWDQETMMPRGSAEQRSEEFAAIEGVLHARRTDPKLGEWLAAIDTAALDDVGRANIRIISQNYERTQKVPADLSAEMARVTSLSQSQWAAARAEDDFAAFAPVQAKVVDLVREQGQAMADGGDTYDALLQGYEPGATGAQLAAMFDALRPRLLVLREKILGVDAPTALAGEFDEAKQMELSGEMAAAFGYDFNRGRIDKAVHPFSSGSGHDVRITTRTALTDPFNCIYSTIHEVGHGAYEQNINPDFALTPLGSGVSMGVHESQSRIYENQMGRGRAFTGFVFDRMQAHFGDMNVTDADAFYAAVNRVQSGYIRTEADEIHYNLHVLLRFDLERALISGDLAVNDLEAAWNDRFEVDFGIKVDKASNGCLQDVHWPVGLIGYFPTYSLGNVYAGCLNVAMRKAVPDVDASLAKGDASPATNWLRENLQQHGGLFEPAEVITRASGAAPSEGPLLDYLEAKFEALYNL